MRQDLTPWLLFRRGQVVQDKECSRTLKKPTFGGLVCDTPYSKLCHKCFKSTVLLKGEVYVLCIIRKQDN